MDAYGLRWPHVEPFMKNSTNALLGHLDLKVSRNTSIYPRPYQLQKVLSAMTSTKLAVIFSEPMSLLGQKN